ncbi:MAG: IclR family transcriptional regulator [Caldilineaceae bacterium]
MLPGATLPVAPVVPIAESAPLAEAPAAIDAYPGAQSVSRAIALLKAFRDAQPEWTLGDLAAHVGLNKATAHRLLAALEAEQLIVRNPRTGGYRLGPELIALGGSAMRSNDLRSVSRPLLEALAAETGETTTLEVLSGAEVVIVDEVSSRHLLGMSQEVGARLPAHATSTGKLLVAMGGPEAERCLYSGPLPALAQRTVTTPSDLHRQFVQIRAQGYAITQSELEAGFTAVAAPVFDYAGIVVAAVSLGGPEARLRGETLLQAVTLTRRTASEISTHLGHRAREV